MVPAAVHGPLERQTAAAAAAAAALSDYMLKNKDVKRLSQVAARSDTAFPRSTVAQPTVWLTTMVV